MMNLSDRYEKMLGVFDSNPGRLPGSAFPSAKAHLNFRKTQVGLGQFGRSYGTIGGGVLGLVALGQARNSVRRFQGGDYAGGTFSAAVAGAAGYGAYSFISNPMTMGRALRSMHNTVAKLGLGLRA